VSEGGNKFETHPPKPESYGTCTLEVANPFGGSIYGWRREMFDDAKRPRSKATSNGSAPPTYEEYEYDPSWRVIAAGFYTFAYVEDRLEVSSKGGGVYSVWTLDAGGRPIDQSYQNPDGSKTFVASYTWDDSGRLLSTTNTGNTLTYDYDDKGFLAHESAGSPDGSWSCRRSWVWTHGPIESVSVRDETGRVSQTCNYAFDDSNRLVSARCTYSAASWQYDGDLTTMALSQSGSLTNVERISGICDTSLTRESLARNFVPLSPDPRPSPEMLRRLQATQIPMPSRECSFGPPFEGDKL
ncbi:MAG: hypothetical protein ACXWP4_14085, partial [Polyangiales bacterium]